MKRILYTSGTVIVGLALIVGATLLLTMNIHDHDTKQVVAIFFGLICGVGVGMAAALVWSMQSDY